MTYNFDKVWDRRNNDSKKWDMPIKEDCPVHSTAKDILPMWIADMDFATPDCVLDAITNRMSHPILGYFEVPDEYYNAIKLWQKNRYNIDIDLDKTNIVYQNSVLGALASFVNTYTDKGEKILVNAPLYTGFMRILNNLDREICVSNLVLDEKNIYRLDFEDMENKLKSNDIKTFIFCSPHNPTGRVWEKWELEKLTTLCDKYNVKIVSDEIWADFVTDKNCKHIPTQSVSEIAKDITMAIYAPSKTFNIGGLIGAYSVIYNEDMAKKVNIKSEESFYNHPNLLACHALVGGYTNGADWVDSMTDYIRKNQEYVVNYIHENFKSLKVQIPQGTYLLWIDMSNCEGGYEATYQKLMEIGLLPNHGKEFMDKNHIRLNVACSRKICEKAMERLHLIF